MRFIQPLNSVPEHSKYANSSKRAWFFPDSQEKLCAKCSQKSPVAEFFKHNRTQDGYHSWCKKCCKEGNEKSRVKKYSSFEGRISTFLASCKKSAAKRQHQCTLTAQNLRDAWENQGGVCAYTGWEMTTQANQPHSVSIERIDNTKGYEKENVILVCNIVNKMKSNFTGELFYSVCHAVVNHLGDDDGNLAVDFKK